MRIFLATAELSQTTLFNAALREGVTRILDLTGGVSTPPVLSAITRHTTRLTAPAILNRELVDAADDRVLLVLLSASDLERVRQIVTDVRPTAQIDLLIGVTHAV